MYETVLADAVATNFWNLHLYYTRKIFIKFFLSKDGNLTLLQSKWII